MKKGCIIKRRGHEEEFDERKLYASCYAACLSATIKPIKAEKICEKISKEIKKDIKGKKCVTSDYIFNKVAELLEKNDKDAAFMYKTHRDIS